MGGAVDGCSTGQVRRQVGDRDAQGVQLMGQPGLLVAVHEDRVDPLEELLHQLTVAEVGLVGQHVVGDDHGARAGLPGACGRTATSAARAGGTQQGEVGRDDRRDDVDDDDQVEPAQPTTGPDPGVGTGPAERADGARERLDIRGATGDGLLAGVEPGGVEVRPGDQRDVVPGLGQLVRQRRGVGRDPALVGVRGTHDRDPKV